LQPAEHFDCLKQSPLATMHSGRGMKSTLLFDAAIFLRIRLLPQNRLLHRIAYGTR
jgi:hypothetical protein